MTFVQIEKRNGMINLDGYSRNKTLKGALKDLAREVAKIDEGEAHAITDNLDETVQMVAEGMDNYPGCYVIEAEEVGCASRYKYLDGDENNYSEENVEIEHAEGHWYLYIRFCAPEHESEEQETAQTASAPVEETGTVSTLTEEEVKFFNDTVARIKYSVNVNVPIEPMDHEQLTRKYKEALGICWAEDNGTGKPAPFKITIDEFFIHECYVALKDPYAVFVPDTLEHVIAHEIAHLHVWRHGKKHTELTQHICRLIEKGEPHGMENNGAAPSKELTQVAMAAMQTTGTRRQERDTLGAAGPAEGGNTMQIINKELQAAFEKTALAEAQPDTVPCICGIYGRACRQMGDKANTALCYRCPLAEYVDGANMRIAPQEGVVYTDASFSRYLCIEEPGPQSTDRAATLERVSDGWTFKAHNVYQRTDGSIYWGFSTDGHWAI